MFLSAKNSLRVAREEILKYKLYFVYFGILGVKNA